jgi:hypothetical protein
MAELVLKIGNPKPTKFVRNDVEMPNELVDALKQDYQLTPQEVALYYDEVPKTQAEMDAEYQDGDIIEAFSDEHIKFIHAQEICHLRYLPLNEDKLNPRNTIQEDFHITLSEFKFERLNQNTIQRTNQFTGDIDIIGKNPNAKGEYMDVPGFIARQKTFPNHKMFGTNSHEVWYGGVIKIDNVDLVWDKIEEKTPHRKVNYKTMPLKSHEKKTFLALPIEDFTKEEAAEMGQGESEEYLDEIGKNVTRILQKRVHKINYHAILSPQQLADALDTTKELDLRLELAPLSKQLKIRKPNKANGNNNQIN